MIIPQKYLKQVNKTESCWLWTGHINNVGYGRFNGKDVPSHYVHRAMFYWSNGYLPESPNIVGHKCEVRNCVNPDHLIEQSQQDNVKQYQDRITECPKGHEYSSANTYFRKTKTGTSRKCRQCNRLREAEKRGQIKLV